MSQTRLCCARESHIFSLGWWSEHSDDRSLDLAINLAVISSVECDGFSAAQMPEAIIPLASSCVFKNRETPEILLQTFPHVSLIR